MLDPYDLTKTTRGDGDQSTFPMKTLSSNYDTGYNTCLSKLRLQLRRLRGIDRAKEDYHQDPRDDYYGKKTGGKRIPD